MICEKCYYFQPMIAAEYFSRAYCKHIDCFCSKRVQIDNGEIVIRSFRHKDIIDFVGEDGRCSRFTPYIMKKVKKKLLGFIPYTTEEKVKGKTVGRTQKS